jgi:hypothetical protein
MSLLEKQEKLRIIISKSEELDIKAYEYGQNTDITSVGARNILSGASKNPRSKNIDIMLNYIKKKESDPSSERSKSIYDIDEKWDMLMEDPLLYQKFKAEAFKLAYYELNKSKKTAE